MTNISTNLLINFIIDFYIFFIVSGIFLYFLGIRRNIKDRKVLIPILILAFVVMVQLFLKLTLIISTFNDTSLYLFKLPEQAFIFSQIFRIAVTTFILFLLIKIYKKGKRFLGLSIKKGIFFFILFGMCQVIFLFFPIISENLPLLIVIRLIPLIGLSFWSIDIVKLLPHGKNLIKTFLINSTVTIAIIVTLLFVVTNFFKGLADDIFVSQTTFVEEAVNRQPHKPLEEVIKQSDNTIQSIDNITQWDIKILKEGETIDSKTYFKQGTIELENTDTKVFVGITNDSVLAVLGDVSRIAIVSLLVFNIGLNAAFYLFLNKYTKDGN